MRIAVATDDGQHVAQHTGRCGGFAVFEIEAGGVKPLEHRRNTFTHHQKEGGHGDGAHDHADHNHSHTELVDALSDCCALVTRGLGPRLVKDLSARGIDAYVCEEPTVAEAAALFAAGRLARASGAGCCRHG